MRAACQDTCILDEPRLWKVLRDVLARAARQPIRTLAVAALATGSMLAVRVSMPPAYVASLTFRMTEGDVQDSRSSPNPPARIREYISNVALTREQLLALMEKHGVAARLRQVNPEAALESMRQDIEIEVVRNYFLFDRRRAREPRSAQIFLSFWGDDRAQVQAVVHDIGTIILESQAAGRSARLSQARELNALQARQARDRLQLMQEQHARLLVHGSAGDREDRAGVRAELALLEQEIRAVVGRVQNLERRAADLQFSQEAEQQRLGLSFRLVDESVKAVREPLRASEIAGWGTIVFAVVSPILAVFFGAFNPRIYRAADVTASGFPLLGTVPRFAGDDAGALRARRARPRQDEARTP